MGLVLHLVVEGLDGKERFELQLVLALDVFGEDGAALLQQVRVELVVGV